jgi:hypothetical protein
VTDSPDPSPTKRRDHKERDQRLARALRENLHRRKQQARDREQVPKAPDAKPPKSDPSA